jgi:CHAD domain-containing protein
MPSLPPLSYALHADEKISHGFFRVLGDLCTHAESLARSRRTMSELIHDGRVLIKRTRALLWFARPALDKAAYAQAKAELRKAAQLLSTQRDQTVTQATLKTLVSKTSQRSKRTALNATLKLVETKTPGAANDNESTRSKLENAMKAIGRVTTLVKRSTAKTAKWPSATQRVKKAFHATRRAEKKALQSKKDVDFHTWRKKAKRLFYELELTRAEEARHKRRAVEVANKLQDKLGAQQDCVVVESRLRAIPTPPTKAPLVTALLKKRKKRLRKKSRKIARRLGAEI